MVTLKDEILTFRTYQHRQYKQADYRSFLSIFHAKSGLGPLPRVDNDNMGPDLEATVDLGRWLVECPICMSAVVLDDEDLLFICPSCGLDDQWSRVIMPARRTDIEDVLLLRPGFREANTSRFWFPNETVLDLLFENVLHGADVPDWSKS